MASSNPTSERIRVTPDQTKDSIRTVDLPLESCAFDPNQPRKYFDEHALEELAASIERHGLLQPITVRRNPRKRGGYVIVAGERRFRAFQSLGREVIPAVVTSGNPEEISLIENLQRENLSPIEEAEALEHLKNKYKYTQEELGRSIGKAHNTVAAVLKLNDLPRKIKKELPTSEVASRSLLIELATIRDRKEQLKFWSEAKEKGLTVRDIRKRKRRTKAERTTTDQKRVVTLGKRFVSELKRLSENEVQVTSGEYEELLDIFEGLGQALEKVAQTESD